MNILINNEQYKQEKINQIFKVINVINYLKIDFFLTVVISEGFGKERI